MSNKPNIRPNNDPWAGRSTRTDLQARAVETSDGRVAVALQIGPNPHILDPIEAHRFGQGIASVALAAVAGAVRREQERRLVLAPAGSVPGT